MMYHVPAVIVTPDDVSVFADPLVKWMYWTVARFRRNW
jgi:hypothetical protein